MKSILPLFILLCSLGCESQDNTPSSAAANISEPFVYLALGDSYTIGEGVDIDERWPAQLVDSLAERSIIIDSLRIIAQTGWRTDNLEAAMDQAEPLQADLVSLLIGVNDQFQFVASSTFESGFDSLLDRAISIAGDTSRVFVVSIPDYGVTPFGASQQEEIAAELDAFNAYMQTRCLELGVQFVNITEISRSLGDSDGALAPDELHPSALQYAAWVQEMLPYVESLLQ